MDINWALLGNLCKIFCEHARDNLFFTYVFYQNQLIKLSKGNIFVLTSKH